MPASITLSQVSWSAPDGRPLFSNLDLSFGAERTGLVGRNGVGKTTLLKLVAGEIQPHSGTVSVSGSLGVLRQSVQIASDETVADLFGVTGALAILRRAEVGAATADELASAAELVMKKSAGIPVAIVRGFDYESRDASGLELIRVPELDLFR